MRAHQHFSTHSNSQFTREDNAFTLRPLAETKPVPAAEAFWIGGNVPVVYNEVSNFTPPLSVFEGDFQLSEDVLKEHFISGLQYIQPLTDTTPRDDARSIELNYIYDKKTGEILLGCTYSIPGLRVHQLCHCCRIGNFIITHIDHHQGHGTRYAYIMCLENLVQFNYHSFQRIVIANAHLEHFAGMEPDEVFPDNKRWQIVADKHAAELDVIFMDKKIRFT